MKITKKIAWLMLVLVGVSAFAACSSGKMKTEQYPQKEITMIIPYGAGGTADLTGRQFALALEKQLGKHIVIINQSGASGSIGTKTAYDAKADGYTLLYTADSLGTQRVMGLSEYGYDSFSPILPVVDDTKVIVVREDSPYNDLQDLIEDMRNRPNKVKMSYTGPGGSGHVQALIYNQLGLEMALTAYSNGAECITAVLGRQVDFTNANYSTITGYLESGDLKLLGISAKERMTFHPEIPTLGEEIADSERFLAMPFTPLSLVVHKDTPVEIQNILRKASLEAVKDEDWQNFIKKNGLSELYRKYPTLEETRQFYQDWQSVVCWLLWDAGVAKNNPADFNIPRMEKN